MAFETIGSSLSARAELWINTAYSWLDKPFFGHGIGGFDSGYAIHRAAHVDWIGPTTILSIPASDAGAAHNEPLQFLQMYGLTGTALAAICIWLLFKQGEWSRAFAWVLLPVSLIGFPFQNPATGLMIAVGLGVLARTD